jgi:hypothetical protein
MYIHRGESGFYNMLIRLGWHFQQLKIPFEASVHDCTLLVDIEGKLPFRNRMGKYDLSDIWEAHTSMTCGRREGAGFDDYLPQMIAFGKQYQCRVYSPHIGDPVQAFTLHEGILEDECYTSEDPEEGHTTILWDPQRHYFYDEGVQSLELYSITNSSPTSPPIRCAPCVEDIRLMQPYKRVDGMVELEPYHHNLTPHYQAIMVAGGTIPLRNINHEIVAQIVRYFNRG